jgi:phenylalanyl-tRNA synthetase alpha chain
VSSLLPDGYLDDAAAAIGAAATEAELTVAERAFAGRGSAVSELKTSIKTLDDADKRAAGKLVAETTARIAQLVEARRAELNAAEAAQAGERDRLDLTLGGHGRERGHLHLVTQVQRELEDIFVGMGYEVYDGPEVEDDYHCFEALNMPPDHPARDMQDTFYLAGDSGLLLRTHTSSSQIRYMLDNAHPPDVRIICPGRVYRRDDDITHSPVFNQIEGLVVGRGITLGDLKGTIEAFLHQLFGPDYPVRFRPSFFPYTEPSVEADLRCIVCGGKGCRVCKQTGWLEILGSGMVDPAVFEAVNKRLGRVVYDPEQVSGFAFGMGIERVAMVRYGVDDIRLFFQGDLRFLEQFEA